MSKCEPALPMGLKRPEHDHGEPRDKDLLGVILALRAEAPMRKPYEQHDESDLDLFRSCDEKELDL